MRKIGVWWQVFVVHFQLQWGRTFSSAENGRGKARRNAGDKSFNGAALFQVRKIRLPDWVETAYLTLQWGRTFSSAEKRAGLKTPARKLSFNGAALFQVRKKVNIQETASMLDGFNGAALFQVRKTSTAKEN